MIINLCGNICINIGTNSIKFEHSKTKNGDSNLGGHTSSSGGTTTEQLDGTPNATGNVRNQHNTIQRHTYLENICTISCVCVPLLLIAIAAVILSLFSLSVSLPPESLLRSHHHPVASLLESRSLVLRWLECIHGRQCRQLHLTIIHTTIVTRRFRLLTILNECRL